MSLLASPSYSSGNSMNYNEHRSLLSCASSHALTLSHSHHMHHHTIIPPTPDVIKPPTGNGHSNNSGNGYQTPIVQRHHMVVTPDAYVSSVSPDASAIDISSIPSSSSTVPYGLSTPQPVRAISQGGASTPVSPPDAVVAPARDDVADDVDGAPMHITPSPPPLVSLSSLSPSSSTTSMDAHAQPAAHHEPMATLSYPSAAASTVPSFTPAAHDHDDDTLPVPPSLLDDGDDLTSVSSSVPLTPSATAAPAPAAPSLSLAAIANICKYHWRGSKKSIIPAFKCFAPCTTEGGEPNYCLEHQQQGRGTKMRALLREQKGNHLHHKRHIHMHVMIIFLYLITRIMCNK